MNHFSPHLQDETKIVWLEDPKQFPYLREKCERFSFRSRFPLRQYQTASWFKLIGYTEISASADRINDAFYRRLWWFKQPGDPFAGRNSPSEGVKTSSIALRKPSEPGSD